MAVYLLHLDRPLAHARHYIGWAKDVNGRIEHHRKGSGARFTQVLREKGIGFTVARIWQDGDKTFERRLKNYKKPSRFCPCCRGDDALHCMEE